METAWKRPKVIPSTTYHIDTNEGTLHLTLGYEEGDDGRNRLIEVRGVIGKAGTYSNVWVDTICKLLSCYIQSPEPRFKFEKKLEKLSDITMGMEPFTWEKEKYQSVLDVIIKMVRKEISKQLA
jgi:hypothetical protein